MAKSLVLGNGSLTVGYDQFGQVKDCYFDYVGLENQMGEESVNRVGVWVDGQFSWVSDGSWNISIDYKDETLIATILATNDQLGISLEFTDAVYNETAIFIRHVVIKNRESTARTVKIFFNHEFRMYGVRKGDTVYWDPEDQTIVHYKGRRVAVIGGIMENTPFQGYTVGLSTIEGKEGTWKDAEDGLLSGNSIEHGTVDSTVSFAHTIDSEDSMSCVVWVSFAKTLEEAKKLHQYAIKKSPGRLIESTENYWRAWVNKMPFSFYGLNDELITLFKKSLLITRVHVGNNGEIVASVDSDMLQWGRDNYNYVWPRDGAYVAMALDHARYSEVSRRFFEFCRDVISEEGYFFHKYRPDKSMGSSWHGWVGTNGDRQLPIQEDETALVIIALWHHYEKTKDIEFIESIYNSLIKKAGNFLLGFRGANKLPYATYDLWEMKMGTHTFTTATVYGALLCAAQFATLLGKEYEAAQYTDAAKEVQVASELLWNKEDSYFYKSVTEKSGELMHDESIDASSFYGAWKYELFAKESKTILESRKTFEERLTSSEPTGGIVRFAYDEYYRENPESLGNPWIITTLWDAQYRISLAKTKEDLMQIVSTFEWVASHAQQSGILPEQVHPKTGRGLSAAPLAWSHAEFVTTIITYLEKAEALGFAEVCPPETETID